MAWNPPTHRAMQRHSQIKLKIQLLMDKGTEMTCGTGFVRSSVHRKASVEQPRVVPVLWQHWGSHQCCSAVINNTQQWPLLLEATGSTAVTALPPLPGGGSKCLSGQWQHHTGAEDSVFTRNRFSFCA